VHFSSGWILLPSAFSCAGAAGATWQQSLVEFLSSISTTLGEVVLQWPIIHLILIGLSDMNGATITCYWARCARKSGTRCTLSFTFASNPRHLVQ
jgi:hypothetical protein